MINLYLPLASFSPQDRFKTLHTNTFKRLFQVFAVNLQRKVPLLNLMTKLGTAPHQRHESIITKGQLLLPRRLRLKT